MRPGRRRGPGCGWPTWPPGEKDSAAKAGLRDPAVCTRASPSLCGAPVGRRLQLPTRIARAMSFEFVDTVREREIYIYVHFPPRAALGGSAQERRDCRNPSAQRDAPWQPVWVELNPKGCARASLWLALWSPSGLCVSNPDAFFSS